jgi:hypothetical protein
MSHFFHQRFACILFKRRDVLRWYQMHSSSVNITDIATNGQTPNKITQRCRSRANYITAIQLAKHKWRNGCHVGRICDCCNDSRSSRCHVVVNHCRVVVCTVTEGERVYLVFRSFCQKHNLVVLVWFMFIT